MCGFTGWVDYTQNLEDKLPIIERMGLTLKHRGPDESGAFSSRHACFYHNRLIVVDPEGGKQPMTINYMGYNFTIVYNGELYNTIDLRNELKSIGFNFHTNSDTEVLLVSYIAWGKQCTEKLNGIFAFAVYDEMNNCVFIARDRLGVKPLFYAYKGTSLIFASEIKAILRHPDIDAEIDEEGLNEILIFGPSRTPGKGVFKNIYELKPGQSLLFDSEGIKLQTYWTLKSLRHEDDFETTTEKVRYLLKDAVERQLVADVPVCTLLSGGLDSSLISYFASKYYEKNGIGQLNTYSIDYVGNNKYFKTNKFQPNSDSSWVTFASEKLNTRHHYIELTNEELSDALYGAMLAKDLPGMADIDSSLYLFCREIKKDATVALSGECADEIFGGYPWYTNPDTALAHTFPWIRMVDKRSDLINPDLKRKLKPQEYIDKRYNEVISEVDHLDDETFTENRMRDLFYVNMTHFMAMLLDRKDRMSMAFGLEVRVPFADHRLVEYLWNVPWSMKYHNNTEKGLLRHAMKGYLPDEIVARKKSPYPKTHNPIYLNRTRELLNDIMNNPNSPLFDLIDKENMQKVIDTSASEFYPAWFSQLMGPAQLFAYYYQVNEWLKEYNVKICL